MQPFVRRWQAGRPSATALVVSLSVGFYVAQFLVGMFLTEGSMKDIFPKWLALDGAIIEHGQWWKFLTFGLLHNGPQYLLANMLLLFFAGREVEPIVEAQAFPWPSMVWGISWAAWLTFSPCAPSS